MGANDNDRIAYLAGEGVDALTPDERAELDELQELARRRVVVDRAAS